MSGEISFLENDIHSLSLNIKAKNENFTPKYKQYLNEDAFESCYDVEKIIGSGGFAIVYCGVRKVDNKQYAIKHIDKTKITSWFSERDGVDIPMEVMVLIESEGVQGVNVMVEYFERLDSIIIILQKPNNCQDLFDQITSKERLDEGKARSIMADTISILIHLKQRGIYHNDVKDENLVVDLDTSQITLIDFGSAVIHPGGAADDLVNEFEGTRVYSPPEWVERGEMWLGGGCVWSLGVLLFNMVVGDVPFHSDQDIQAAVLPPCAHLSPECRQLIENCLQHDRLLRPSLPLILSHPWMNNINNDN